MLECAYGGLPADEHIEVFLNTEIAPWLLKMEMLNRK